MKTLLMLSGLVGLAVVALAVASASTDSPKDARRRRVEDLAWMTGLWRQEGPRAVVEELWMAPRAGRMLGLNRTVPKGDGQGDFEFLRIEERGGSVFYVASPEGAPPTHFELVELEAHRVVFANPTHDFPKRIEYALDPSGALTAHVSGDDGRGPSWTWKRVAELR